MKKLFFVIALTAALSGSVFAQWLSNYNEASASVSGSAVLKAGVSGEGATAATLTYSNAMNGGWSSYMRLSNPYAVVTLLQNGNAPRTDEDLYASSISKDNTFDDIYFAVFLSPPPLGYEIPFTISDFTFNVWGGNAAYTAPLDGQRWFVYLDNEYIDTFVWDTEHVSKDNPMYSLGFNGYDVYDLRNAAVVRLSTTAPEGYYPDEPDEPDTPDVPGTQIPEPASAAYALLGLGSLIGVKRRIKK